MDGPLWFNLLLKILLAVTPHDRRNSQAGLIIPIGHQYLFCHPSQNYPFALVLDSIPQGSYIAPSGCFTRFDQFSHNRIGIKSIC